MQAGRALAISKGFGSETDCEEQRQTMTVQRSLWFAGALPIFGKYFAIRYIPGRRTKETEAVPEASEGQTILRKTFQWFLKFQAGCKKAFQNKKENGTGGIKENAEDADLRKQLI